MIIKQYNVNFYFVVPLTANVLHVSHLVYAYWFFQLSS